MQNAQRQMQKYGQKMTAIGSQLSVGVTLPVLAMGAATVKAASDAEETSGKFDVVFRDIAAAAQKSADTLRNSYGLSSRASQQLLADTGDLLTGFGFSQKSALDLSTQVNQLAVDLASFTNYSGGAEGASAALTKALLGERESVKALGISILEEDVKARVLLNTKQGLTFESERQAKAYATLQIAQEQSKNALGDYARTSQSFANQSRLMKARLEDVAVQFGEILLPYVTSLVGHISKLVDWFSNLSATTKKIILVVAGLAAALGPVLVALGFLMTTVIPGIIAILPTLGAAFTAMTGPIGLVVAAIAAIAFMVYKHWDRIKQEMVNLQNYFIDLYNESMIFRMAVEYIALEFKTLWNVVKLVFGSIWEIVKNLGAYIVDTFKNAGAAIKAVLTGNFKALPEILGAQMDNMGKTFVESFKDIGGEFKKFTNNVTNDFNTALANVTSKKKIEFKKADVDATGVTEAINEAIKTPPVNPVAPASGRTPMAMPGISITKAEVTPLQNSPFDVIVPKMEKQGKIMSELQMQHLNNAHEFNEGYKEILQNTAANFAEGFGAMVGHMMAGNAGMENVMQLIMTSLADLAIQVGKMAIGIGVAVLGIKKALQSLSGPVAIAAGIALVALGTMAKSVMSNMGNSMGSGGDIPKFADGGMVYGPTLGLMGEYAGARRNPEVIAPLNKLQKYITEAVAGAGGQGGRVEFVIKGADLYGSLNRYTANKGRKG